VRVSCLVFLDVHVGKVLMVCRRGLQLTDEIEFEKASEEVDEENAEEAMKEYSDASK
jgi:hypothetical protein